MIGLVRALIDVLMIIKTLIGVAISKRNSEERGKLVSQVRSALEQVKTNGDIESLQRVFSPSRFADPANSNPDGSSNELQPKKDS